MIEKRNPVRHYVGYAIGLIGGITAVGLALDLSDHGGGWYLVGALLAVTVALWLLESAIISWHEFNNLRWRFHCQICHADGVSRQRCEFHANTERVVQMIRDSHMENVHHHYVPEEAP